MSKNTNLMALLIDGDNVQATIIQQLLFEINKHGNPIIKKVFLNKESLTKWEVPINQFSLSPVWVPNNTRGKNAADIELVIDAMELLYERQDLAGFCIVSSDSDFTGLAKRIVAKGKPVLGIGENKTPESFRNACTKFICIEDLPELESLLEKPDTIFGESSKDVSTNEISFDRLFIRAYEITAQNTDGWIPLLEIKEAMNALDPEFQSSEFQNTRRLAERIIMLKGLYPERILEIDEKLDSKPVIHYIRVFDCDIFKFIEAYKHSPIKGSDGWVLLSVIGDELRKYPAYENGFTYRGIRRLNKVVNRMMQDYGEIIEMHEENDGNSVIHLVWIKL